MLFETPGSPERTPAQCFEQPQLSGCFSGIVDLGAIDVQRGRDHGIPSYAQLREALGLGVPGSFDQLTGEQHRRIRRREDHRIPRRSSNFTSFTDRKGHNDQPGGLAKTALWQAPGAAPWLRA